MAELASLGRVLLRSRDAAPLSRFGRQLLWVSGGFALAVLPHLSALEWWVVLLSAVAAAWRLLSELRRWRLPHKLIRAAVALAAMLAVLATYRTLNGLQAGTAFLALMGGMKLLETRTTRDLAITVFVGYFLLFAGFLYNQDLLRLPYMLATAWLLTATLMLIHQRSAMPVAEALGKTARMLLQAAPIAVLLFLFFPRLPGQFWALPTRSDAMTGLSDEMSPGDVSELSVSGALAFRVKFDAGPLPPPRERYWRGPVLHDFDGRTWRRPRYGFVERPLTATGPSYNYRIVVEPHHRNWIFPLDAVIGWPQDTRRTADYQLMAKRAVAVATSFKLRSSTTFRSVGPLPEAMRAADLRIPAGSNTRSIDWARRLRAAVRTDSEFVQAVLARFRNEEFFYTLAPPKLAANAVDDFLFNTRRGFCEHYASAFTLLARAAGIPARVVTGYQGGEYNPLNNYLLVRQSDAHAWSEIWLEQGWQRIDPTAAVAPERVERGLNAAIGEGEFVPGRIFARSPVLLQMRRAWDAVNTFWRDQVVEFGETQQRSLLERFGIDDPDWRELGVALLLSLVAFFVLLSGYLAWQFRPRPRDPLLRVYAALGSQLARHGLTRQPHEGPNDYLRRVITRRPELATQINEIRNLYVDLRYGPALLSANRGAQLSRLKFLVNQLPLRKYP